MFSKMLLEDRNFFYWKTLNTFLTVIFFGILIDNERPGVTESLINKFLVFL